MPDPKKKLQVFISHASEDKAKTRSLCEQLKQDGFDPWLDEERLLPGQNWSLEIEKALRTSHAILLCFSSLSVQKEGYIQHEYKRAMKYQEEKPEGTIFVIPVRLDECEMPFFIQGLQYVNYPEQYHRLLMGLNHRIDSMTRREEIKHRVQRYQEKLRMLAETDDVEPEVLMQTEDLTTEIKRLREELNKKEINFTEEPMVFPTWSGLPYPGMRAFTDKEDIIFFGRERETNELIQMLKNTTTRFVAITGASGSGKSSLVRAGLIPQLRRNCLPGSQEWIFITFTPGQVGDDPFMALAAQLEPLLNRIPRDIAAALRKQPEELDQFCNRILEEKPAQAEILFFIDQFEELFRLASPVYRIPFTQLLGRIADSPRMRIIATLRADLYHECLTSPQITELLNNGNYNLTKPGLGSLYEMITRPAAIANLEFDSDLPEEIMFDTGRNPGALPLLAYALSELYHLCKHTGQLTWKAYRQLGGVQQVTGKRAEEVFNSLDENAQKGFTTLFWNLVQVDESGNPTRHRASKYRVYKDQAVTRLADALINARLLIADQDHEAQEVVEIAHEALLKSWGRLVNWLDEVQGDLKLLEKVRIMATEWEEKDRNPAFLWPDERLKEVESALTRLPSAIRESKVSPLMWEFIRPEMERLLEELRITPKTSHTRRVEIGNRMDVIGDNRSGVGLVFPTNNLSLENDNGLPDIKWCEVPGGSVTLEDGAGRFPVRACFIAQYPVTYIQFQAFVSDPRGYKDDKWWEGLTRRASEPRNQRYKISNQPRENIWWCEAVAFCRWLAAKYAMEPSRLPHIMPDWIIRLPTEWEWEQAATGEEPQKKYPWGSSYDNIPRANTQESGLGRTTAVGMYPDGASPVGILDLCGNIWEWCLNEYERPTSIGFAGSLPRARRGGSFEQQIYRAAFRNGFDPYFRYDAYIGFRVLYGPILNSK